MQGLINRNELPGLVALLHRRGETHVHAMGHLSIERNNPVQRDTIFRIASLTKPVTAVAALMLIEDGVFRLEDSIDTWLPELANRRVLKSIDAQLDDTVPAQRAITVRDLLTLRMGLGSVMAMPDTYPIQTSIRKLRIGGDGPPQPLHSPSADEWLRNLSSLPLIAQPGSQWLYDVPIDVLGCLVARASGKSLAAFMRERIFEPLNMQDTAFYVPESKRYRLATSYTFDSESGAFQVFDESRNGGWNQAPRFESGGGGLVSTADDFLAFYSMLLNRGLHGKHRLLSEESIAQMATNQLTPAQRRDHCFLDPCCGWGFGVAVNTKRDAFGGSVGRYGWDGGLGTSAYIDPKLEFIGILLTQRMMDSPEPPNYFVEFWQSAYATLND